MDVQQLPIPFASAQESIPSDEMETEQQLTEALQSISETTLENGGRAMRGVHAKSHGILRGTITIPAGLPAGLAQGLFAEAGSYPVIMRFSTPPGDVLDDSIGLPRGLAVKVLGVPGDRLSGSEGDTTQDFVMVNGPAFAAPTPAKFLGNLKLLAKTTDTPQIFKKIISSALRGVEATLEAFGTESAALKTMGGAPQVHPLGESFFSQTPFLFGNYVAKFSILPISPGLTGLTGTEVSTSDRPDALREEMNSFFAQQGGSWAFRVQLRTDAETMPIEDSSVPWPEESSPYVTVAELKVEPQTAWLGLASEKMEDGIAFSPWHGLAAHRPLGGVNRVRKGNYEKSAAFRGRHNGCPMHEPRSADGVAAAPR